MAFKWRKWNRVIHRDFGYLLLGMTIIYALSGIALNHIGDWNPNYIITNEEIQIDPISSRPDRESVKQIVDNIDSDLEYKNHYFPDDEYLKSLDNEANHHVVLSYDWYKKFGIDKPVL